MVRFLVVAVVLSASCKADNVAAPVDGKDGKDGAMGLAGIQGPKGEKGDKGDKGDPGSGLLITQIDGGAIVTDADGGMAQLTVVIGPQGPKGDKGEQGTPGMTGAAGAQGPVGPSPVSMALYDVDGGEIGPPIYGSSGSFSMVYLKSVKCVAQVDFEANVLWATDAPIHFTGPNCTGMPFASGSIAKPIGCLRVRAGGDHYRAHQPITVTSIQSQSKITGFGTADGGTAETCVTESGLVYGVVLEQMTMPNIVGPFSFDYH